MSVLASLQQLLHDGNLSPPRLRLSPVIQPVNRLSTSTSTSASLNSSPPQRSPVLQPLPAPSNSRRLSPLLSTRSPLFSPSFIAHRWLLLSFVCLLHVGVILAVWYLLIAPPPSPHLPVTAEPLTTLAPAIPPAAAVKVSYTPPISLLSRGRRDKPIALLSSSNGTLPAVNATLTGNDTHPIALLSATSTQAREDTSFTPPTPQTAIADEGQPQPLISLVPTISPLQRRVASPASSSLLSFTQGLQTAACSSSSSSSSSAPPSLLVYSCLANSVSVEHDQEEYLGHHLGGVYALPRALLMAVATQRALVLDQSECKAVAQLNDTRARQTGLACCEWQLHLLPITPCDVPSATLSTAVRGVSPFSLDPIVAYDVRQQCLWTDEVWDSVSRTFPDQSQLSVMRTLTSLLLQPSTFMSGHVAALKAQLPLDEEMRSLALHLPPFTSQGDEAQQLTFSRYLPLPTYLSFIRNHAATSSLTPSSLLLWASDEDAVAARAALPHLQVVSVLSVVRTYWQAHDPRPLSTLLCLVLLLSSHVTEWVGLHASVATQLVQLRADRDLRVWDLHGDSWTPSCWSSSPHLLSAHHAEPRGYNNPALTSLLASSPASPASLSPPTQLIVVLGNLRSGVEALNKFLARMAPVVADEALSNRWTSLFVPRNTVERYHEHRTALLSYLGTLLAQPHIPRRLLMWYRMPEQTQKDLSLFNHHHVAWLAQMLNAQGWRVSLKVLVMVRDVEQVMRNVVWTEATMKNMRGDGQAALLPVGRAVRDVTAAMESECEAMDVSVYRTFLYPRLWDEAKEVEAARLASFLLLNATESVALVSRFVAYSQELREVMFQKHPEPKHQEDGRAMADLTLSTAAMQLFNTRHPSYQAETLDYQSALTAATQLPVSASMSFTAQLEGLQKAGNCGSVKVLVFDGFLRWTRATQLSTQVLDLLRTMSLALATGRMLVAPRVVGTVLEWIEPVTPCGADSFGLIEVTSTDAGWTATGWDAQMQTDPFSSDRVVISHSQVIDVAYLAVWNTQHSQQGVRLSVHDFVCALLRFIIRPTPAFQADHATTLTSPSTDLTVILPVAHHRPLSSYEHSIDSLVSTQGIRSLSLTWTDAMFQHRSDPSFLSLLDMDLPPDGIGHAMVAAVSEHVQRRWPNLTLHLLQPERGQAIAELSLLARAAQSSRVLGSMGSEMGFLTASLLPYPAWWDFFGDQYIPSLLALNHNSVLHSPSSSVKAPPPTDAAFIPPVVEKKSTNSNVRFAFVAGLEGTGHHGVGHLLQSIRVYTDVGVWYRQVQVDEWLNNFGWKMLKETNVIAWERYKRQLSQRIKWRLEQYRTSNDAVPIFVINTVQDCIGGMMSYPNTDLAEKTTLHPQLATLARMMEELGADFRVIALARTPGSSLASAVKRDHGVSLVGKENAFHYLARVARANLAALDADIAAIDPRFTLTIATETIQTQPALVARAIARHLGLVGDELIQAAFRMKEEVIVHPSSHWMSSMNTSEVELTQDVLDISSHIPMSDQFAFSPGLVGGQDEVYRHVDGETTGYCRRKPMGLRHEAKDVLVVTMEGAGADYLRTVVEEVSAVMASTHEVDHVLPPSTAAHLDGFTRDGLTAFRVLEYSIDRQLSAEFPSPSSVQPTLILTRNPLDIALTVASNLMQGLTAVSDLHTWDFSRDHFAIWRREHLGEVVTLMRTTLQKVAQLYVHWANAWEVAQRRQQMLERGVSNDGVRVLRLEDFLAAPRRTVQELLGLFELPVDPAAVECVQAAAESTVFSPRIMSNPPVEVWTRRTQSGHARLNESMSSLQYSLASASYPTHATASHPFRLSHLIPPDVFVSFRQSVEVVAASIEGPDWDAYCDEVQKALRDHWAGAPNLVNQPTPPVQPPLPSIPIIPPPPSANANSLYLPPGQGLPSPEAVFSEARKLESDLAKLQRSGTYDVSAAANKARARLNVLRKLIQQLHHNTEQDKTG